MAEAKRRTRKRRLLLAVLAVVIVGGTAGAAVALSESNSLQAAAACPGAGARVYAVPSNPAHPSTAPAWPPGGTMTAGGRFGRRGEGGKLDPPDANGRLWQVTAITALPGDCRPFLTQGLGNPGSGLLAGRLAPQLDPRRPARNDAGLGQCSGMTPEASAALPPERVKHGLAS